MEPLYLAIVTQARRVEFFKACGVPDTVFGRFDMVVLHAFLVLRCLRDRGPESGRLAQALFDYMFADVDLNLRELGVGDLSVGKKVKQMARGYYGRAEAYETGLREGPDALAAALRRNLFAGAEPRDEEVAAVEAYVRREAAALSDLPLETLLSGAVVFGPPPSCGASAG